MIYIPAVNLTAKMPKKMMDALNRIECICAATGVESVTDEYVKTFLTEKYSEQFANTFKPDYLIAKSL